MYTEIDYYAVLGVSRDATTAEIRKAYKMLALSHHPDKVPEHQRPEAETKFKEISEAYEILCNEAERSHYDAFGPGGTENQHSKHYDAGTKEYSAEDFARFFGFESGDSTEQNGGFYANSGAYSNGHPYTNGSSKPNKGRKAKTDDVSIELEVTLEELYKGKTIKMNIERDLLCGHCAGTGARKCRTQTCRSCEGSGFTKQRTMYGIQSQKCKKCDGRGFTVRDKDKCHKCGGKGLVSQKSILEVYVPKGAPNNHIITFKGKADEEYGKDTGDLHFIISTKEHEVFARRGNDLCADVTITLSEALIGFSRVLVRHLDNRGIKITVQQDTVTEPGCVFKVIGDGMPLSNMDINGDLYLNVHVEFPPSGWCLEASDFTKLANILPNAPREPLNISSKEIEDADFITTELPDKFLYAEINEQEKQTHEETKYAASDCQQM